jgi:beta-N-acetylhexosaminidase
MTGGLTRTCRDVAAHTAAFVTGIQSNLVAACAKHFPGHGRADMDSHVELPVVAASLHELGETDLAPFRAAIEAGVRSVMTAHVVFPAIDKVPATISRRFLAGLLREELGFGGVIITDALGMAAIGDGAARADGAVRSLAEGADLLCLPAERAAQQRARDTLAAAVGSGRLSSARLAESAARVRALAAWARARPASPPDPSVGAEAARRALLVDTATVPLPGPPYVLDAGGGMSSLLGDHAGSLLAVLRERDPAVAGVRPTEPRDNPGRPGGQIGPAGPAGPDGPVDPAGLEALIARGAGRPLVLAVRDAHRRAWQRELVGRVLARRPDAVVVGTGTLHDRNLASGSYLGTRGAGRANLAAAADVLLGRPGPDSTRNPDGPPGRASPGEPAW